MKSILLVEDEPFIAQLARAVLEQEGYRVTCAENGREALEILDEVRPDLVLTDNMMPLMNGLDLCSTIRERTEYAAIPIIMMSAGRRPPEADTLLDAFIMKPFLADELITSIETALNHKNGQATGG